MKTRYFQLAALFFSLGLALVPGRISAAGHGDHGAVSSRPRADAHTVYTTGGVIRSVDPDAKRTVIEHDPVPALNWPAMTMGFVFEDASLLEGLKVGDKVRLDFRNRGDTSVIVDIEVRE